MRIAAVLIVLAPMWGCVSAPGHSATSKGVAATPEAQGMAHYLAAAMLERQGKFEDAVAEIRKASDASPASPSLSVKLVFAYLRLNDIENARIMCERAVAASPENAQMRIMQGVVYQELKRYDDALNALKEAIRLEPDSTEAYEAIFRLQENTNDLAGAIDMCEKLLEFQPKNARIQMQLGTTLARVNDSKNAAATLERALETDPKLTDARFVLGLVYLDLNENAKAVEQLQRYIDEAPAGKEKPSAKENLAGALARIGKRSEAVTLFAELGDGDDVSGAQHALARIYLLLREGRGADAELIVPPNGAPIFGSLLRALVRRQKGEPYRPVLESLDQVDGEIDQECHDFLLRMMSLFGKDDTAGYFLAALGDLRKEGIQSKNLDMIEARTLMALERNEDAAKLLEGSLSGLDAAANRKTARWIHYYLASAYETLNRFSDAEPHLKKCVELEPGNAELLNFLGYMYAEENVKLSEAETLVKKALEIEPENGAYQDSLGWVYYRKGDAANAIKHIRQAIVAMPTDDPVLRDHLGDAYLLKGDTAQAIGEWRHALRLDPKIKGVQEKIDAHQSAK